MISLNEAAKWKIERIRLPMWAGPMGHIKIDIVNGDQLGPWVHLWCPFNKECGGHDPLDLLWVLDKGIYEVDKQQWEPYMGPIGGSDKYEAAKWKELLCDVKGEIVYNGLYSEERVFAKNLIQWLRLTPEQGRSSHRNISNAMCYGAIRD